MPEAKPTKKTEAESTPAYTWAVLSTGMSLRLQRKSHEGKGVVDKFGEKVFGVRSLIPGEPYLLSNTLVNRLIERGAARRAKPSDFDNEEIPAVDLAIAVD